MMGEDDTRCRRRRPPLQSQRVGTGRHDNGERTAAYRALEPLTCGQCGMHIVVGTFFSRHAPALAGGGLSGVTTRPICGRCRPLYLDEDEKVWNE